MHPLNILDHTAEWEDKWKLDRMKTWKNWSRQGEDEGEVGDLMKKVEDGEVDGEQVHTLGWQVILPSSVKKSRRGRRWGPSPIWSEPNFLVRTEEEKLQGEWCIISKRNLSYDPCFHTLIHALPLMCFKSSIKRIFEDICAFLSVKMISTCPVWNKQEIHLQ